VFSGAVDRDLVVPEGPDGRPGFRLRAAGDPVLVGVWNEHCRSTTEFHLPIGPRSLMICQSEPRETGTIASRGADVVQRIREHPTPRTRLIADLVATRLGDEDAVAWTAEVIDTGVWATDLLCDRGAWSFVVSVLEAPSERPHTRDVADLMLASWEWLPSA
jgi:hypothetical protein